MHNKLVFAPLSGNPGVTTTYVGSLYEETNSVGIDYVFLGSTRLASISAGKIQYYHTDHLGGTNVITSGTGTATELLEYKPFGEFSRRDRLDSSSTTAWYCFTSKPLDDETGLYYYGARYYNPKLGRFITPDTIVQAPNNPQTLNRYTYCNNNPVNLIDPTGHSFISKLFKSFVNAIGSFIGGIVGGTGGAFLGAIIGGPVGAFIGGFIGANIGSGTGQSIQHGGDLFTNIGNSFISSFEALGTGSIGAGIGFMIGGPTGAKIGAMLGVVGLSVGTALSNGESFEDAIIAGIVTTGYMVAGIEYYKAVGSDVIDKGIAIYNARQAGSVQPIGTVNNTKGKSLNVNQGGDASNQQALKLKPNYDVEGRIVSYDLAPENSPNFIVDSNGQAFPVPAGATGPIPVINNSGRQTGIAFTGGNGGANGQVSTIRVMNPRGPIGNSPGYPNGYVTYGNNSNPPQNVNPYTGRTGAREEVHFPINK